MSGQRRAARRRGPVPRGVGAGSRRELVRSFGLAYTKL